MKWVSIDPSELTSSIATLEGIRALRRKTGDRSLYGDPAWVLSSLGGAKARLRVLVCRDQEEIVGYLPLREEPWAMPYRLGEVTVFSYPLPRLLAPRPPTIDTGRFGEDGVRSLLGDLLTSLSEQLGRRGALFLQGVQLESSLHDFLTTSDEVRSEFRVVAYGPPSEHHVANLPEDFAAYLKGLSRRTREGLRRRVRGLQKHVDGEMRLRRFVDESEVCEFLDDAIAISKTTYQWHLLGLGLRDRRELETSLRLSAKNGWFWSYILYLKDQPAAFMIGDLYEGMYHYVDVGFDPAWTKWSVGTVMHMEVLRDLIECDKPVELMDFSQGTGEHKRRFGNDARVEADYIVLRRDLRSAALSASFRGVNQVSVATVAMLDRLNIKAPIKKFVRRFAAS